MRGGAQQPRPPLSVAAGPSSVHLPRTRAAAPLCAPGARSHCPFCSRPFAYHPRLYHSRITCSECDGEFGFRLYTLGPRIEASLRATLLEKQGQRQQQRGSSVARRGSRHTELGSRHTELGLTDSQRRLREERLFTLGLADACPRCGHVPPEEGERARRRHLQGCVDEALHARHARAVEALGARRGAAAVAASAQEEASTTAAWQYLGGQVTDAWMLTDSGLVAQCEAAGLQATGSRVERLARLAAHQRTALVTADAADAVGGAAGGAAERASGGEARAAAPWSMPANLHAQSLASLRELCAINGIELDADAGTDEAIGRLEALRGTDDKAIEAAGQSQGGMLEAAPVVAALAPAKMSKSAKAARLLAMRRP